MDASIPTDTTELAAADERLKGLEAEQAKEFEALDKPTGEVDTTPSGDRAPEGGKKDESALDSKPTGTPSEADKEKQEVEAATAEAEKEGKELEVDDKGVPKRDAQGKFVKRDKKPVEQPVVLSKEEREKLDKYLLQKQGSKYAKDLSRRIPTWVEINEEKEKLEQAKTNWDGQLKAGRARFDADVVAFRAEQAAARPTPEKYDAFASKCADTAKVKEAEAIMAEKVGEVDKAEQLRDEAKFLKRDADAAKASADHLRKNPPPSQAQQQQKFQADQKTWIEKAAVDFPEFGKKDSPLQKAAMEYYREIAKDPAVSRLPGVIYFAAERAALKSAADRVPALEKELGELKAKVKEQDELLNPTPSGGIAPAPKGAKAFEEMSEDEQYASLHSEAATRR